MKNDKSKNIIIILLVIIIAIMAIFIGLIITGTINLKNDNIVNETEENNNSVDTNVSIDTDNNTIEENDDSSNSNISSQKSSVSQSQILSYYKEKISVFSEHLYAVSDINNDGIPELFIYVTGTIDNLIIADTSVYTYDENKGDKSNNYIINVGSVSGRLDTNTLLYKMNDGRLLSVYGHMGYESTAYFTLENNWLVREKFSSRATNDYISGDKLIEFKKCNDTSLIDNYS